MNTNELEKMFARASRIREDASVYHNAEEWERLHASSGIKRFKRKVLGLCGISTVKTYDEIAQILNQIGVVPSVQEGGKLALSLVGRAVEYDYSKGLEFTEVINPEGKNAFHVKFYKKSIWPYD